jgi:hypothetical protein
MDSLVFFGGVEVSFGCFLVFGGAPQGNHMKCSTSRDALNNHCCRCGRIIPPKSQFLRKGPFRDKINEDRSLHLYCDPCYKERAAEAQ